MLLQPPDAQPLHPVAVEHSDAYQTRAKIHKYASFATLPLFGTELVLGQSLYTDVGFVATTQSGPSWNSLYANHAALRTAIEFTHIGGLVVGGGCAITADLAMIAAARDSSRTRATELQLLKRWPALLCQISGK